ncbi:uncharacterized protein MONBRDRAFT_34742 [Monosiga brevicollis MX1]|uniref:SH3 domain-containing protein n=1 Tax=Monosiga brevicollis TaxID=81824 RepID=A9VDQ3_MONBE|nr:uncharacterized protein MONBRDRAFT_34742 [Monosiga brevicollis MX1]EDQ84361.1 predicted protein [Monosiga brevicollis MX1]|eukprot:XP_001750857.1 hypothetical protein [Monosiga brevicollis MX1]
MKMDRWTIVLVAVAIWCLAVGSHGLGSAAEPESRLRLGMTNSSRPNIVFLICESIDAKTFDEDSPVPLPNIRKLIQRGGVSFKTHYVSAPVCAPSRTSIQQGRHVHRIPHDHNGIQVNGAWNNYEGMAPDYDMKIGDVLGRTGYDVNILGKTDWTAGKLWHALRPHDRVPPSTCLPHVAVLFWPANPRPLVNHKNHLFTGLSIGGHALWNWWQCFTMYTQFPYNVTNGGWNEQPETQAGEGAVCDAHGDVTPGNRSHDVDWMFVEQNVAYIRNHSQSQPFFVYQGMDIVHPPLGMPSDQTCEKFYNMINESDVTVPDWAPLDELHPCDLQSVMLKGCLPNQDNATAVTNFYSKDRRRRVRRIYYAMIAEFDAMVGEYMQAVEDAGLPLCKKIKLREDVKSLSGLPFQMEHQQFYKMVPLVIAGPGIKADTETLPTQHVDLYPTFMDFGQVPASMRPEGLDGISLVPRVVEQKPLANTSFAISQFHGADLGMSWYLIRYQNWKLVTYGTGQEVAPQLFDMVNDPGETHDVHAQHPDLVAQLDALLRSRIDYPSVSLDVATYNLAMGKWWINSTGPGWKDTLASFPSWGASWARRFNPQNRTISISPPAPFCPLAPTQQLDSMSGKFTISAILPSLLIVHFCMSHFGLTVKVLFEYDPQNDDELRLVVGDLITNVSKDSDGWWSGTDKHGHHGVFPDNFVEEVQAPPPAAATPAPAAATAPSRPAPPPIAAPAQPAKKYCKCTFEYDAANDDELTLAVGDVVEIVNQDDEGWWEGIHKGKTGLFPSNFVEECPAPAGAAPAAAAVAADDDQDNANVIQAKKVQGIGFGNIFAGGSVALRKTSVSSKKPPPPASAPAEPAAAPAAHKPPTTGPTKPPAPAKKQFKAIHDYTQQGDDELSFVPGDIITLVSVPPGEEIEGWLTGELNGRTGLFPDNFVEELPMPAAEPPAPTPTPAPKAAIQPPARSTSLGKPPVPRSPSISQKVPPPRSGSTASTLAPKPSVPSSSTEPPKPKPSKPAARIPPPQKPATGPEKPALKPPASKPVASNDKPKPPAPVRSSSSQSLEPTDKNDDIPPWKRELNNRRSRGASMSMAARPKPAGDPAPKPTPAPEPIPAKTPITEPKQGSPPAPAPEAQKTAKPTPTAPATQAAESGSAPSVDKAHLEALEGKINDMMTTVEKLRKAMQVLTSDLDAERAERLKLQVEVDRLKKFNEI